MTDKEEELPVTNCPLKLKTLKDIEVYIAFNTSKEMDNAKNTIYATKKAIKKEAIKIFLSKYNPNGNTITDEDWLGFFNITDEELQEATE